MHVLDVKVEKLFKCKLIRTVNLSPVKNYW